MGNVLLARMGEVTLKGLNRGSFEIQLKSNLKYRLKKFGNLKIYQSQSRIWIEPKEEDNPNFRSMASAEEIMKAVCQVFGIVSVSLARKFEGDFESIKENAVSCVKELLECNPDYQTFKVESKRGNKTFPMTSPEICDELGGFILDTFPDLSVKVKNPDFIINVEIRESKRHAFGCRIFSLISLYERPSEAEGNRSGKDSIRFFRPHDSSCSELHADTASPL